MSILNAIIVADPLPVDLQSCCCGPVRTSGLTCSWCWSGMRRAPPAHRRSSGCCTPSAPGHTPRWRIYRSLPSALSLPLVVSQPGSLDCVHSKLSGDANQRSVNVSRLPNVDVFYFDLTCDIIGDLEVNKLIFAQQSWQSYETAGEFLKIHIWDRRVALITFHPVSARYGTYSR